MRSVRFGLMAIVVGLVLVACGGPGGPGATITLETLQDGQVVSSNVLVRGGFPVGISVSSLAYSVNGGSEVDVTATIQGRAFVFTIAGSVFVEGSNVIRIVLRPVAGSAITRVVTVVYDPDAPPPVGADVIVLNDINPLIAQGMLDPNNVRFMQNLVDFQTIGPRSDAKTVWLDRGRTSKCGLDGECNDAQLLAATIAVDAVGYSLTINDSSAGSLTTIPANVKAIMFWTPTDAFTTAEINALKAFAGEGGRIVYIGEWAGYYPPAGIDMQNRFLEDMGAVMRNTGGAVDCQVNVGDPYRVLPASSLRPSALTAGLEQLSIACASVIELGPNDYPIFYDTTNTVVLAGVATIDVTPLAPAGVGDTAPAAAPMAPSRLGPAGY